MDRSQATTLFWSVWRRAPREGETLTFTSPNGQQDHYVFRDGEWVAEPTPATG